MALTDRQERFCYEYMVDQNATQAYIRAGYSPKGAHKLASRLMANDGIREKIEKLKAEKESALIATSTEVLQTLTRVLRREEMEQEVAVLSERVPTVDANGKTKYSTTQRAEIVDLKPSIMAVNKAAELLGKYHTLWTDKVALDVDLPVILDNIPGGEEA